MRSNRQSKTENSDNKTHLLFKLTNCIGTLNITIKVSDRGQQCAYIHRSYKTTYSNMLTDTQADRLQQQHTDIQLPGKSLFKMHTKLTDEKDIHCNIFKLLRQQVLHDKITWGDQFMQIRVRQSTGTHQQVGGGWGSQGRQQLFLCHSTAC